MLILSIHTLGDEAESYLASRVIFAWWEAPQAEICVERTVVIFQSSPSVSLYIPLCCDHTPPSPIPLSPSIYASPPPPLQSVNSPGFSSGRLLHSQTDSLSSNFSLSSSSQLSPSFIIHLFPSSSSSSSQSPYSFSPSEWLQVFVRTQVF